VYNPHGTYNRRVTLTSNVLAPANLNTNPIPTNTWLNIRVRPIFSGGPGEFGPACRIRFVPNVAGPGSREMLFDEQTNVTMSLYPNPNRDGLVTLSMEGVDVADETMIDIDIYDMLGKRVFAERAVAAEGIVNHRMDISDRTGAGLYMVNVTIEGKLYTQRLVIQ
jgi:Secretion system C-terminal sorting domain